MYCICIAGLHPEYSALGHGVTATFTFPDVTLYIDGSVITYPWSFHGLTKLCTYSVILRISHRVVRCGRGTEGTHVSHLMVVKCGSGYASVTSKGCVMLESVRMCHMHPRVVRCGRGYACVTSTGLWGVGEDNFLVKCNCHLCCIVLVPFWNEQICPYMYDME